jgi:flavin-dependent dehydrogenase
MPEQIIRQTICIVGAGPGGLMAALDLAQRGIPSVVVEKATFPRHKADGDALTSNVLRTLYELSPDLYHRLKARRDIIRPINGFYFNAPNGKQFHVSLNSEANNRLGIENCFSCKRIDFDYFLWEEAQKHPLIQLVETCSIHDHERTADGGIILYSKDRIRQIHARLVIVASGSNSHLARTLGGLSFVPKEYAVGLRAYYKGVTGMGDITQALLTREVIPGGICLVPMADGTVSVSVIIRSHEVIRRKANPKKILEDVVRYHPFCRDRFQAAELVGEVSGASLHLGVRNRKISGDNYLLIGDAAGLADPINANGIGHAMITGRLAAAKAAACIDSQDFSARMTYDFSKLVHDRLHNSLKVGRTGYYLFFWLPPAIVLRAANMATLFSSHTLLNGLMNSGNLWKTVGHYLRMRFSSGGR